MGQTLHQRCIGYEELYSGTILKRVPVVIKIDGRSFSRLTKNTSKPFCQNTMLLMNATMLSLAKQIDGVIFGFQYSDKIFLFLRNDRSLDEDPWFGNNVQKICSVSSSMATYEFINKLWETEDSPQLDGSINFSSKVFPLPNIKEVINYLIYRQFRCLQKAINETLYSILWPKYGNDIVSILDNKDMKARKQMIDESGFSFDSLPIPFRLGTAAYIIPVLVNTSGGQVTHQKWILDFKTPLFSDSKQWLTTILSTGSDIFRPERDYNDQGTY